MADNVSIEVLKTNPFFAPDAGSPTSAAISELINRCIILVNVSGPENLGRVFDYDEVTLSRQKGKEEETLNVALPEAGERGIDVEHVYSVRNRRWWPLTTRISVLKAEYQLRHRLDPADQPQPTLEMYSLKTPLFSRFGEMRGHEIEEPVSAAGVDAFTELVNGAITNHIRRPRRFRRKDPAWLITRVGYRSPY